MPHYSDIGVDGKKSRQVCKYCGRPLKQTTSKSQGCGEICRQKHRFARYRVIGFYKEGADGVRGFDDSGQESNSDK